MIERTGRFNEHLTLHIVMGTLIALGKGLAVVDVRPELEQLAEIFDAGTDES